MSTVGMFLLIGLASTAAFSEDTAPASWLSSASNAEGTFTTSFLTATVTTDKRDYTPGETVIINGSGFQPGETVTLQVIHIEGYDETVQDTYTHVETEGEGHEPWDVVADADGNISSTWYVHPDDSLGATFLLTALGRSSGLTARSVFTDGPFVFEGQCKSTALTQCGSVSNPWVGGNLKGWKELDLIPARVRFTGPVTNESITIEFDRLQSGFPGIENLTGFTSDTGVTFTSPVLSMPSVGKWAYSFNVTVLNSGGGSVRFNARMAAGAHQISGSGLAMSLSGGGGNLQISKPAAAPGNPDLTVTKSGPATVSPDGVITYNLTYSNKTTATSGATGVQLVDTLPAGLTYEANSCSPASTNGASCVVAGNTITWDLGTLAAGAMGSASYQARVSATATNGQVLTNAAAINLAENDVNSADNYSHVDSTVSIQTVAPSITTGPAGATKCVGESVTFSVVANGTPSPTYQWRKGGSPIGGATGSSYTISSVSGADAASYDVVVSNSAGTVTSSPAVLTVNTAPSIGTQPAGATKVVGDSVTFSVTASGSNLTYQWRKGGSPISGATNSSYTISSVALSDAGSYDVVVSGACSPPVTSNAAVLGVNGRPATVTADDKTITYGDAEPNFTYQTTGLQNGDSLTGVTCGVTGAHTDAGTYPITCSGNTNNNYAVTYNPGTLTVSKAATTTTVTFESAPYVYRGSAFTATASVTGPGNLSASVNVVYSGDCTNVSSTNGCTATATYAATSNYLGSSDAKSITITKATASITVNGYTGTYDGAAHAATGTATGVGGVDLSSNLNFGDSFTNVPGGTATWTFTGGTNYKDATGTAAIVINKALATATAGSGTNVYDGGTHSPSACTVSGAFIGDLACSNTPATAGPDVSTTSITPNVTGSVSNFEITTVDGSYSITKADATIIVNGYTGAYDGSAHGANGTATGVGGIDLSAGLNLGDSFTNVPGGTATWTFTGGMNYKDATGTAAIVINKASSSTVVTCSPETVTYTGAGIEVCSVSVTGAGGLNLTPAPAYADNVNVGSASASYSYAGDDNHEASNGSDTFAITKAASTTVVTCGADSATYTGAAIEICSVSVTGAGGLNLTPTATYSNNVNVGTATASYEYIGDENHEGSNGSDTFSITKAGSTTVVTCSSDSVTYTGSAIEICSVSVTGANLNLNPSPAYSNNTNVGTATASYTYEGDDNHEGSSGSDSFAITKAGSTTVVTCSPESATYTGSAIEICSVSVTGTGLNLTPLPQYANNVSVGTATASYTYSGDDNHEGSQGSDTFAITKASSTTVVTCTPDSVTFTGAAIEICSVSVTGASLNLSPIPSYANNVNVGTASASYTFAGDDNHEGSNGSDSFAITKAASTTVVTCTPESTEYTGSAIEICAVSVTGPNLNLTPAPGYANNVNVGTATASYSYAGDDNHEGSNGSDTFTITKAASSTVVTCSPESTSYTGGAIEICSVSVTGIGGLNLTPMPSYSNNVNVGTATASYTYDGDDNHLGSNGSDSFSITKAGSTTVVTCNPETATYTGSAIEICSVSVTGTGGLSLSPLPAYSSNTNVGTASASYTYDGDDNHDGSSGSDTFAITKAGSTTAVTCNPETTTFTGAAIEICTVSVTGVGGLNLTPAATYSNNVNVGTASATYNYSGDDNHTGSSGSDTFAITKAGSLTVVTCTADSATYTGSAIEICSVSVTGSGGLNLNPAPVYSNNVSVGTATASYVFDGDDNHEGSNGSDSFAITKAVSTTVVTCPDSATYTGSAIEACTVAVTGTGGLNLAPLPEYANNLNVGTASASYTFAGDGNHEGSTGSDTFAITKASSSTFVTCSPESATYTGSAIEICTVSVTGVGGLNATPAPGYANNTNVGTATASYTFDGDANHEGSNGSDTFEITKAGSVTVVTCTPETATYTGAAIQICSVSVTGANLNLTPAPTYAANVNVGTATASYTFAGDSNHDGSNGSDTFEITKAGSTTTVTCSPKTVTYTGAAIQVCSVSVTGANLNLTPAPTYSDNTNVGTATASYNFAGDNNHDGSNGSDTFAITKANQTITFNPLVNRYIGNAGITVSATGGGSGNPVTFASTTPSVCTSGGINGTSIAFVGIGQCSLTASQAGNSNYNAATSVTQSFMVVPDTTTTTLDLSGSSMKVYDCERNVISATVRNTVTNLPVPGVTVTLNIGTQSITAITDNTGKATGAITLTQTVGGVVADANFAGTTFLAGSSAADQNVTIAPNTSIGPGRDAASLYTGSLWFWTTSSTSSTATLTLSATIANTGVCQGDIARAKVSFLISTNIGTSWSPVSSAQNLPVGLVDPTNPNVGTASAISQYNIGNTQSVTLQVRVVVGGQYNFNQSTYDLPITIGKPGTANSLMGGGMVNNNGNPFAASGFLGLNSTGSSFGSQVTYNKSGTNPQGQVTVYIDTLNRPDGTRDTVPHRYFIKSNSISELSTIGGAASFGSKTNVSELLADGTKVGLDGGGTMQVVFTPYGKQIPRDLWVPGSSFVTSSGNCNVQQGCMSIIAYKSTGGVWYSSSWGQGGTTTAPHTYVKPVLPGGNIAVN